MWTKVGAFLFGVLLGVLILAAIAFIIKYPITILVLSIIALLIAEERWEE